MLKIGVFGGTFNPPHFGHVQSVEAAAQKLGLDLLIVVPAKEPPHKSMPENSPPADMRYKMTRIAFENAENTIVSDIEINSGISGYTVDTIGCLSDGYPGAEFYLVLGTDMFLTLESWKDAQALIKNVVPVVFPRGAEDIERISEYSRELKEKYGADTAIIDNDIIDISSSRLRELLPKREGLRYIPDTIYAYIIRNRLYGAKPDWDWLRARAHSLLEPSRIPHVDGCETEAIRLAARWGVDIDDAREAAILHDITKKLTPDENMLIFEEHGIPAEEYRPGEEKLLHSKTGAVLAKADFGVSGDVANAIMWHTTGRAAMSVLEKIIYLADYIEPTRDFAGVGELRELAYTDVNKAVRMGLEMSISDMRERGIAPNTITYDALSDLRD